MRRRTVMHSPLRSLRSLRRPRLSLAVHGRGTKMAASYCVTAGFGVQMAEPRVPMIRCSYYVFRSYLIRYCVGKRSLEVYLLYLWILHGDVIMNLFSNKGL